MIQNFSILLLLLSTAVTCIGQSSKIILNYDLNEWKLDQENKKSIINLFETLGDKTITKVKISGHTDAKGENKYNDDLSKKRAEAVKREVLRIGKPKSLIDLDFFGENRLIEKGQEENQTNRRVEVVVSFEKELVEATQQLPSIEEILSQLVDPPQLFCINNNRDTVIRGEQGTIVLVKANSIARTDGEPIVECVQLELQEAFSKSDMLLNNLTTTSNGELLESEGMFNLSLSSQNAAQFELVKEYVAFVPTDSVRDDVQVFDGHRHQESNIINWTPTTSGIGGLSGFELADCIENYIFFGLDNNQSCRFFFCKIKKWMQRNKTAPPSTGGNIRKMDMECSVLDAILAKYGVSSSDQLTLEMMKEEFARYGVDNLEDYRTAKREEVFKRYNVTNYEDLKKAKTKEWQQNFEGDILKGDSSYGDASYSELNYYISTFQGFGWKNIDAFSKMNAQLKTDFELHEKPVGQVNLRLVFEDYKIIAPINDVEKGNFLALSFPKKTTAWVIGVNVNEEGFFLAKQKFTIDGSTVELEFVKIEPEELKKELEILNY